MGKIYKVCDLLRTKYLYNTTVKDLEYLLSNSILALKSKKAFHTPYELQDQFVQELLATGKIPTLDLAGTFMTHVATCVITKLQVNDHIKFIDSSDSGRQSVLLYNENYANSEHTESISLPDFNYDIKLTDYLAQLDKNQVYHLPKNPDIHIFALSVLILDLMPDIKLDLTDKAGISLFQWINRYLNISEMHEFNKFYISFIDNSDWEVDTALYDKNTDELETRQNLHISLADAWNTMYPVPTVIGIGNFSDRYESIFRLLMRQVASTLSNYYNNKPQSLYDILSKFVMEENAS